MSRKEARKTVEDLLRQAEEVYGEDPELAHRLAEQAWRIKLKKRVELPRRYKRFVCRRCHGFLMPGGSARVRLRGGMVVVTCLRCGSVRRYGRD